MSANQNPLGPDHRRLPDRADHDLGGDAVDGLAARLSGPARAPWFELVGTAGLSAAGLLLVVVRLRRLCAGDFRRGRLHRRVGRLHLDRGRHRHVGLAGAGSQECRDLWLGALGREEGGEGGRAARSRMAWCSASCERDYLRHDGPEHVLCFAPTRSGKGVGLVVPSLLTWPGSAIVHDIKGENWQLTAGFRAKHGRVLLFDPTNPKSAAYNPLLEVRRGDWEVRDVQNVADVLVDPEGSLDKRNHWEKTSHSLLVGAILHVLYAEADKTLAGVAAFLSDPKRPIEATLKAMMTTPHLGDAGPHPVVASTARELLNKSDNERSGVLSTAMSFLGLYRDPVVAQVTRRCDWRIADLIADPRPATLYLVVPPSDISRTKPLIRLVLNQIGRRLTEDLHAKDRRHRVADDARRVPGARPARLLRVRARLHGGLRHQELPDRAVAEPDREGLWAEQLDPRQLPCPGELRDQRRADGKAGVAMRSARRPRCGR